MTFAEFLGQGSVLSKRFRFVRRCIMEIKSEFSGGLRFISLPDIFQILGGNNATGTLEITSKYAPNPGKIYFVDGEPVNASIGPLNGVEAIYALFGWTEGKFEFHKGEVDQAGTRKNSLQPSQVVRVISDHKY